MQACPEQRFPVLADAIASYDRKRDQTQKKATGCRHHTGADADLAVGIDNSSRACAGDWTNETVQATSQVPAGGRLRSRDELHLGYLGQAQPLKQLNSHKRPDREKGTICTFTSLMAVRNNPEDRDRDLCL